MTTPTRKQIQRHRAEFVLRAVEEDGLPDGICGRVIGQACTYNTVDDYGTFFKPGCFDRTRAEKVPAGKVHFLRDHDHVTGSHVGVVRSLTDVGNAVMMSADLFDTPEGRDAKQYLDTVLRAKAATGLSVGVYPRKGSFAAPPDDPGGQEKAYGFDEVELAEISMTPFNAVPGADVMAVRKKTNGKKVKPGTDGDGDGAKADRPAGTPVDDDHDGSTDWGDEDDQNDDDDRPIGSPKTDKSRKAQITLLRALLTSVPRSDVETVAAEFGLVPLGATHTGHATRGAPPSSGSPRSVDPTHRLAFLREHFEDLQK